MGTRARVTAQDLGINVASRRERDLFHWLMCVLLFSKPVQQEIAGDAFLALKKHKLDTPEALRKANWHTIVEVLGSAQYVRYDESTATRLQAASELLEEKYGGKVRKLIAACASARDVRQRVQEFNGIGPKGAEIFLRQVKPVYLS